MRGAFSERRKGVGREFGKGLGDAPQRWAPTVIFYNSFSLRVCTIMSPTRHLDYKKRKLVAIKKGSLKPFFDRGGQGDRIISGNYNIKTPDITSLYNL